MSFDCRNLPTPPEGLAGMRGPNYVGNIFFGSGGFLMVDARGYQVYKSAAGNLSGAEVRGAGAGGRDKYELQAEGKTEEARGEETLPHMRNFFDAVRKRDHTILSAEIEIGARSAAYCHLANIAYRVGRTVRMALSTGRFIGDEEANALLTRNYRAPYVVTESV